MPPRVLPMPVGTMPTCVASTGTAPSGGRSCKRQPLRGALAVAGRLCKSMAATVHPCNKQDAGGRPSACR
ncbi:hypothetical protein B296_00035102 [Ensete ventricosum]|uniref:Uncharacterized protein n=1 Tax=Ensete ventricosum TaxID=4639 RepID=A0A426XYE1_ENSVE|nr:hypothetical protein B296_00035102 [Ensete ventricosum]